MRLPRVSSFSVVVFLCVLVHSLTHVAVVHGAVDELLVPGTITPPFFSADAEAGVNSTTTNTTAQGDGSQAFAPEGPMTMDTNSSTPAPGAPPHPAELRPAEPIPAPSTVVPTPLPTPQPTSSAPTTAPTTAPPTAEPPVTRQPVPTENPTPSPTAIDVTESPSPPAPVQPVVTPSPTISVTPTPSEPDSPSPPRPVTPTQAPVTVTPVPSPTQYALPTPIPQKMTTIKPASSDGSGGSGQSTVPSLPPLATPSGSAPKADAATTSPSPLTPTQTPAPSTKKTPVSSVDIEASKLPQQAEGSDPTSQQDASVRASGGETGVASVASIFGIVFGACGVLVLTLCVINTRRVRKSGDLYSPVP